MVGSLLVPADMMSVEAASPPATKNTVQKRSTKMVGTLVVDSETSPEKPEAPNSPTTTSPKASEQKSIWTEPMDETMLEDLEDFLYGL